MAPLVCSMTLSLLIPAIPQSLLRQVLIEQVMTELMIQVLLVALFVVLVLNALTEAVMSLCNILSVQVQRMHYDQMTIRRQMVNIHRAVVVQLHLNAILKTCVAILFL